MGFPEKPISEIKSTQGTINYLLKHIERNALGVDEQLSDSPTSSLNLLFDEIGSMVSMNFFEMMMIKQEALKNTAKLKSSLVRYLNSDEVTGIFGTPSSMGFSIGFKISDIDTYAYSVDGSSILRKITINKNTLMVVSDNPPFTFDNDIDIYVRDNGSDGKTYFAKYTNDGSEITRIINNPFIKSFTQNIDGDNYFIMIVEMKQYSRKFREITSINTSINKYEFRVPYSTNLYAFEVFYKSNDKDSYRLLGGRPVGVLNKDGYMFEIVERNNGEKFIDVKFSRANNSFSPEQGSSILIVTYETFGSKGNFYIRDWNNDIPPIRDIVIASDDNPYQTNIKRMTPLLSINGPEAIGGMSDMSVDELRNIVIKKSDSKNLTITELANIANEKGMRLLKERSDILSIYFKMSSKIVTDNIILNTLSGTIEIPYDQNSDGSVIVSPRDVFVFNPDSKRFKKNDVLVKDDEYIPIYNSVNNTYTSRDFRFPYYMIINLIKVIDCRVYDVSINENRKVEFNHFNLNSPSEVAIDNCSLFKNPMEDKVLDDKNIGEFKIQFNMQVNALLFDNIVGFDNGNLLGVNSEEEVVGYLDDITGEFIKPSKYIRNTIALTEVGGKTFVVKKDNIKIYSDASLRSVNILTVLATIRTDHNIMNDSIAMLDDDVYSIDDFDDSKRIKRSVTATIYTSVAGTSVIDADGVKYQNTYSNIVNKSYGDDEIESRFKILSSSHSIKDIELFKDITNNIKPNVDVFAMSPTPIQKTYKYNTYEKDPITGEFVMEDVTINGITVSRKVVKNKIGDPMFDKNGNPVYDITDLTTNSLVITDTPLVDRIHSIYSNYIKTIDSIKDTMNEIDSLQNFAPSGVSFKFGLMNTVSNSNFYYIDRIKNTKEPLDRLTLSFKIGVKYEVGVDESSIESVIKYNIVKYIKDRSNEKTISFIEMIMDISENVQGVRYVELYKVNNLPEGTCHSIFEESDVENNDILTVKHIATNNGGVIEFNPDINIKSI